MEVATNDTGELIKHISRGFEIIYQEGYNYMKAGVVVMGLVPEGVVQASLFTPQASAKQKAVMGAMDDVNKRLGKDTVRMSMQGFDKKYRLRSAYKSPRYTTNINELLKIRI